MTREEAIKYGTAWLKDEYLDARDGAFIKIALEVLKQQPCEDAISRADAKKYLSAPDANDDRVIYESDLDLLPSVTPQPETGYWIPKGKGDGFKNWNCSKCGMLVRNSQKPWYKHCPNCGRRMIESQESEV